MNYKKLLMDLFKKTVFAQILLLMVLIGIIYFFRLSLDLSNNNTSSVATLFINLETERRLFEGEVVKDMTILDALNAAVSIGKIRLNYAIDKSGNVNILEIDGHTNGVDNKYFTFYLNSKKIAQEDLNRKTIRGGDKIEIRNE